MEPAQPEASAPAGPPRSPRRPPRNERLVVAAVNLALVLVVGLLAFLVWQRAAASRAEGTPFLTLPALGVRPAAAGQPAGGEARAAKAQPASAGDQAGQGGAGAVLAPLELPSPYAEGVSRLAIWKTIIPNRPRVDVITYTVEKGDILFTIADKYGLKPETVLWGNYEVLKDNPQMLSTGQVLNILPTNGVYYKWKNGDTISSVASQFNVTPEAILNYPGNRFDLAEVSEGKINIEPGTWLIIEGGTRPLKDWGPPAITRSNAAAARYYGEGSCGAVYEGAIGSGTWVWPTVDHGISGYTFSAIHRGVDIGGAIGNSILASDSGVVVYAGWSNYGYGLLIVIDHGNGWQTAYAHLSAVAVTCGQSVFQGGYIGALGSTGNSSGPHLHFEMGINGSKVNPLDYTR